MRQYSFYQHKMPQTYGMHSYNSRKNNLQMIEHAIVEVAAERKADDMCRIAKRGALQGAFCEVVHHTQVTVDDQYFFPLRNQKAQHPPNMLDDPAIQPLHMSQFMPMTPTNQMNMLQPQMQQSGYKPLAPQMSQAWLHEPNYSPPRNKTRDNFDDYMQQIDNGF